MELEKKVVFNKDTVFTITSYGKQYDFRPQMIKEEFPWLTEDNYKRITNHLKKNEKSDYDRYYNTEESPEHYSISREMIFCPKCHKMHSYPDWKFKGDKSELNKYVKDVISSINLGYAFTNQGKVENMSDIERIILKTLNHRENSKGDNEKCSDVITCPECGFETDLATAETFLLTRGGNVFENTFVHSYSFYKEGDIFTISIICKKYVAVASKEKIIGKNINFRFSYNLKTGQSYSFIPRPMKKDKQLKEALELYYHKARIRNITYSAFYKWNSIITVEQTKACDYLFDAINRKTEEYTGIILPRDEEGVYLNIKSSTLEGIISNVAFCNAFAHTKEDLLEKFMPWENAYSGNCGHVTEIIKTTRRIYRGDEVALRRFLKKNSCVSMRSKNIRRKIYSYPFLITTLKTLEKSGFTDLNVISRLLDKEEVNKIFQRGGYQSSLNEFIKTYLETHTDVMAEKLLSDKNADYVSFFMIFFDFIKRKENYEELRELFAQDSAKLSIDELHDKYERILAIIRGQRLEQYIQYKESELELSNMDIGNYRFRLAKNTLELSTTGNAMSICVGSYDRIALRKDSNIVFMKEKSGKLAACIEYRKKDYGNVLVQFKGYCNNKPPTEVVDAFVKFFQEMKFVECKEYLLKDDDMTRQIKLPVCPSKETDGYLIIEEYDEEEHPLETDLSDAFLSKCKIMESRRRRAEEYELEPF